MLAFLLTLQEKFSLHGLFVYNESAKFFAIN